MAAILSRGRWVKMCPIWALIQYIKMTSYQYRKSHCGDKTIVRSSYLHNGISYIGKMSSLYWIGALVYVSRCRVFVTKPSASTILTFLWLQNTIVAHALHKTYVYINITKPALLMTGIIELRLSSDYCELRCGDWGPPWHWATCQKHVQPTSPVHSRHHGKGLESWAKGGTLRQG